MIDGPTPVWPAILAPSWSRPLQKILANFTSLGEQYSA
jgi:hypothetical protein